MFEIEVNGDVVRLSGRLDAAEADKAADVLSEIESSAVVDFEELAYISSAGLGVLFAAQKRLLAAGMGLKLINLNPHIREVFSIAGFDSVFEIA